MDDKLPLEEAARVARSFLGQTSIAIGESACAGNQDSILKYYAARLIQDRIPAYVDDQLIASPTPLDLTVDAGKLSIRGVPDVWVKKAELSPLLEQVKAANPIRPLDGIHQTIGVYVRGGEGNKIQNIRSTQCWCGR